MLKRFEVKNFMNFKERVSIDFSKVGGYQFSTNCITDGMISKMIIYGRNATGKTNLGRALFDIKDILPVNSFLLINDNYLNADSKEQYADFSYTFQFGINEVVYLYQKDEDAQMHEEELLLNGERIFYYNFETKESDFKNLNKIGAETIVIDKFLKADEAENTIPFLRWMLNNTILSVDSILLKLEDYVERMGMLTARHSMRGIVTRGNDPFIKLLENPTVLNDFESFLNAMGIECKLVLLDLPDGKKKLYFDHEKPVPFFETASSGTIALTNLYRDLTIGKTASLLYLDEYDAFFHYEMSDTVLQYFKNRYPDCQVILTTHNTNLMTNSKMRPDCLFILSRSGNLTPLCAATRRELREGHNLEKLYISGEFEKYE